PAPDSIASPSPFACHNVHTCTRLEHSHYHADTGRGSPRTDLETRSSVTVAGFAETAFTARLVNSAFRRAYVHSPGTRLAVDFHEKATMGSPTVRGCCEGPGFPHEAAMPRTSVG